MIVGGIILLLVSPRDPWPVGEFAYLYVCSIAGSIIGHSLIRRQLRAFLLSVVIASFLFFLGSIFSSVYSEGFQVIGEFCMWMPIMIIVIGLHVLAGTLTVFPIIGLIINWVGKNNKA